MVDFLNATVSVATLFTALGIVGCGAALKAAYSKRQRVLAKRARLAGRDSAQGELRLELHLCLNTYKLLSEPNARIEAKWRDAFEVLLLEPMRPTYDPQYLYTRLTGFGFTQEQALTLIEWRQDQPYSLVTVLLALLTGQPDDEVWTLARKG